MAAAVPSAAYGSSPHERRDGASRLATSRISGDPIDSCTRCGHSTHAQAAHASADARASHLLHPNAALLAAAYHHALATGFARAFLVAAAIALLTLAITIAAIRLRRADLTGAQQQALAAPAEQAQPR